MKSPRRAGVAGGVGEGEVVPCGGVLDGDATLLSKDPGLETTMAMTQSERSLKCCIK